MTRKLLTGVIVEEGAELSLEELSRACATSTEWLIELVEEGVLEPVGQRQSRWRFSGTSLKRARTARRLHEDLHINLAGVALALDLIEDMETMRERLRRLDIREYP
ncbi:MAG: chaperone modulator CbpM [Woeseiaceae bacterium]